MAPREGLTLATQAESATLVLAHGSAQKSSPEISALSGSRPLELLEKNGSEGGARTLDLAVNSRLLHH